jgi:hypothetical protein
MRWYLVHPQGLVLRRQGEAAKLPTDADVAALGLDVSQA